MTMTDATPAFSSESKARIKGLMARYPQRRAALIPVLWLAQREFGWLSREVMQLVAAEMELPESWVFSTASFYTMLHKKPVGKYHIQVCTNISCYLRGSDDLMQTARDMLGIDHRETTEDGLFTLESVQCLAACGFAPVMQINKEDHFSVDKAMMCKRIESLQAAERGAAGGANG
jgi:NADH-quinone oxidoreductase E subunit